MVKIVALSSRRADSSNRRESPHPSHSALGEPSGSGWERPRLLNWLSELGRARIVLLQAPAAYGKTAALHCIGQRLTSAGRTVVHLSCRRADEKTASFVRHLNQALSRFGLDSYTEGTSALADDQIAERLAAQIDSAGRPIDLIVDEEAIRLTDRSLALLWDLVLSSSHLRVIVAGRRKLTGGLARARTLGHVVVGGPDLLRLDHAECRALFAAAAMHLSEDLLETVMSLTDGWPLALKVLTSSARDADSIQSLAHALGMHPEIADFFAEEVLRELGTADRDFLRAIAALERICPELADAITGQDGGREHLDRLCDDGRFVTRAVSDEGWYRLHPVFAAFLRFTDPAVGSESTRIRFVKAKQWFERSGRFIEAFDYAVRAGEMEGAARLLDAHSDDLYLEGFERSILPITSRLPPDVRERFPRLLLAMSWRMMTEWRFDQADALLDSAQARLEDLKGRCDAKSRDVQDLEYEIKHRRIMQWLFKEDFPRVVTEADLLVRDIEHRDNPYLVMSLYSAMMYAQRELFQLGSLDRLESLAREQLRNVPSQYMHVFFEAMAAPGKLLRGETDAVIALLESALQTAVRISRRGSPVGAPVALMLSEARYVCDDTVAAEALLDEYLPVAINAGFVDQLISGYLTRARLHRANGNVEAALAVLHDAERIAAERGFRRLGAVALSERISLLCHAGEEEEAIRVASWEGLRLSALPPAPRRGSTREENARALAWARLAQIRGQIDSALVVAKSWRAYASAAKATASVIEWDILRAQLLLARNEETSAQRVILQALALACPARRVRPFLDDAGRLAPILQTISVQPAGNRAVDQFIGLVVEKACVLTGRTPALHARRETVEPVAIADLTARELGILKVLAAGHSNSEIGKRLGLTAGTVKWYLHRIYGKLGCERRMRAIDKARRLGFVE